MVTSEGKQVSGEQAGSAGASMPVPRIGRFPLPDDRIFIVAARVLVERWAALLAPTALAGLVLLVALVPVGLVAAGQAYVVDHGFGLIGPPRPRLWWALGCWLVLALVAVAHVVAAEVRIVRGALDERPVRVRDALRASVGSVPGVSALLLLVMALMLAVVAGAVAVAVMLGMWVWLTTVVLALCAWWLVIRLLVAVPAVVIEGVGPLRGIRAAHRALRQRGFPYVGPMLFLVVGVSWGLDWLAGWLLDPVEEAAGLVSGTVSSLPSLLLSPLWACLLSVVLLNPRPPRFSDLPRGGEPAREKPVTTGPPALRRRALPLVLVALVIPGLLVTGLAAANPTGLATGAEFTSQYREPVDAHRLGGGRTASVVRHDHGFEISFCDRSSCPPDQTYDYDLRLPEYPVSSAALPDGTVVVAAWVMVDADDRWDLRLFHCDRDGCPAATRPAKAPPLHTDLLDYPATQDMAVTSDGRIVVAAVREQDVPAASHARDKTRVELVTCADVACANPRRQPLDAPLEADVAIFDETQWALTLTADDRPVLVGHDEHDRIVTVVCDSVECSRPIVATTSRPRPSDYVDGFDATVDADGRPMVTFETYSERRDPRSYVLRCQDGACRHTTVTPVPQDQYPTGIAAGAGGDPVLALRHEDDDVVTLEACAGADCADRRTLTTVRAPLATWLRDGGRTGPLLVREDPAHDENTDHDADDDGESDGVPYEVTSIPADRLR